MNKRIKELAEQVGFKILPDGRIIPTLDHNGECGRDLQKFAELIVRECISKCEFYNDSNWGPASECIAQDIKQHFGVEE